MKILLPLDDSESSNTLLEWAIQHLKGKNVDLQLLTIKTDSAFPGLFRDDSANESETHSFLDSVIRYATREGVRVDKKVVMAGDSPAESICDYADENDVDLIMMGTEDNSFSRLLLGSVSHNVVKHTSKPVLIIRNTNRSELEIIRPDQARLHQQQSMPVNILLPVESFQQVPDELLHLLNPAYSNIHLLHVIPQIGAFTPPPEEVAEAQQMLGFARKFLHQEGFQSIQIAVKIGNLADEICTYANENSIDQIVLSTREEGNVLQHLMGSLSAKVFEQADQPVLLFHKSRIPSLEISHSNRLDLTYSG